MVCDRVSAQQLAEEFEDCTTLAYIALRTPDSATGRAMLVEYVSRFGKVFITELLALLFADGRSGDMLQFVLEDLPAEYRELGISTLEEFIAEELQCNDLGSDAEQRLLQLRWVLELRKRQVPDNHNCELATQSLHTLCHHGGSHDQRISTALACLTAAAAEPPRAEGGRSELVTRALNLTRLRELEVELVPEDFCTRGCGVGQYPLHMDTRARSWKDLVLQCLSKVSFESLKSRFHDQLQNR